MDNGGSEYPRPGGFDKQDVGFVLWSMRYRQIKNEAEAKAIADATGKKG